jgi:hypothetical protein
MANIFIYQTIASPSVRQIDPNRLLTSYVLPNHGIIVNTLLVLVAAALLVLVTLIR